MLRVARRWAPLAATLGATAGCSAVRSRFASHEDVFPPIPLSIGEMRVVGSDTVYALSGRGYEVVAPTRDVLPDAQQALDAAARSFQRHLEAEPPRVVVDVRSRPVSAPSPGEVRRDTLGGDTVRAPLPRPRKDARDRAMMPRPVGVLAIPVARAWLTSYAAANAPTNAQTANAGTEREDEAWGQDPRVPDWLEVALPPLVAESPIADFAAAELGRQSGELIPLRALFDSTRALVPRPDRAGEPGGRVAAGQAPPADRVGPSTGAAAGGRGRGRRVEPASLFDVQSIAVARFLAERAGPAVIGELLRASLRGARIDDVLRGQTTLPGTVDALDAAWRAWVKEQRPRRGGGA